MDPQEVIHRPGQTSGASIVELACGSPKPGQRQSFTENEGVRPLLALGVATFEKAAARLGFVLQWRDGMTLGDKAAAIGRAMQSEDE